jgi:hypothetical protein
LTRRVLEWLRIVAGGALLLILSILTDHPGWILVPMAVFLVVLCTVWGALLAGGGLTPDWAWTGDPPPWPRIWLGAGAGSAVGALIAAGWLWVSWP